MQNTKWLITGGCGFIGANLVETLRRLQPDSLLKILDNFSGAPRVSSLCDVSIVEGDVRNIDTCVEASKNADVIVHLAANVDVSRSVENPRHDFENNVLGTFNMLEAAKRHDVKKFIFASSAAPLGDATPPIHEELACHPLSPYGSSKLAGEAYCSAYCRSFGIQTVALRFGNVYGPGSLHKNCVISKFIKQSLRGIPCEIYGDGGQTRDFIYVKDLVQAIVQASSGKHGGEIFQIATSKEHTLNELAEMLKRVLGEKDILMDVKYVDSRKGEIYRNYSDTSKAKKELHWEATTSLREGLEKTVDFFIKNYSPPSISCNRF